MWWNSPTIRFCYHQSWKSVWLMKDCSIHIGDVHLYVCKINQGLIWPICSIVKASRTWTQSHTVVWVVGYRNLYWGFNLNGGPFHTTDYENLKNKSELHVLIQYRWICHRSTRSCLYFVLHPRRLSHWTYMNTHTHTHTDRCNNMYSTVIIP